MAESDKLELLKDIRRAGYTLTPNEQEGWTVQNEHGETIAEHRNDADMLDMIDDVNDVQEWISNQ